jgi:hypothetical protein
LAARCGATVESLQTALERSAAIRNLLEPCRYRGACSDFAGRRWWRAGVESLLWKEAGGKSLTSAQLFEFLNRRSRNLLTGIPHTNPVVVLNDDFSPNGFSDVSLVVRVVPDDWPPYASEAWAAIESVRASSTLKSVVLETDRALLSAEPT